MRLGLAVFGHVLLIVAVWVAFLGTYLQYRVALDELRDELGRDPHVHRMFEGVPWLNLVLHRRWLASFNEERASAGLPPRREDPQIRSLRRHLHGWLALATGVSMVAISTSVLSALSLVDVLAD